MKFHFSQGEFSGNLPAKVSPTVQDIMGSNANSNILHLARDLYDTKHFHLIIIL